MGRRVAYSGRAEFWADSVSVVVGRSFLGSWQTFVFLLDSEAVRSDALTNDRFEGFDPALRLEVDWAKVPTGVMSSLLEQGSRFKKEIAVRRDAKATAPPTLSRRTVKRKREQRTPWEG